MTLSTMISLALVAAPAGGGYTREQLKLFAATAVQEFERMQDRCSTAASATTPDLEAEAAFRRSADLMELFARYEVYTATRVGYNLRSDDVAATVQALERAYLCHPGYEQRHYLLRATALLEVRLEQIRVGEQRPLSDPDGEMLQQALVRVRTLTRTATPPPPCERPAACPRPKEPPPPTAEPIRGYHGKYTDLFSLRIELAGGIGTDVIEDLDGDPGYESLRRTPALFSLAPGVRFLAGRQRRHVLEFGFRWTLVGFKHPDSTDFVQQMVVRLGYGIRLHERWFSVHASFEPGVQAHANEEDFGRSQIGGSGAMCTWNEAFCARFGGYYGARRGDAPAIDGTFLGAGFDIFRVTDNILRRAEQ